MSAGEEAVNDDSHQQLHFSCHCGRIRVSAPRDPPPTHINQCMCSNCRKHGAAFIYYPLDKVTVTKTGSTNAYVWAKEMCEYTWCSFCGCLVYWYPTDKFPGDTKVMGVNSRCVDDLDDLRDIERRLSWEAANAVLEGVYDEKGPIRK